MTGSPHSQEGMPPRWREDSIATRQSALLALSRDAARGDPDAAVRRVTEATARALGVERVSVWRYTADRRALRCADLYEATPDRHSAGVELAADNYPTYFRELEASEVVAADDARADPRTREFVADYLPDFGIGALLDVSLRPFGRLEGVLCCEHVGPARAWAADEQVFAVAVGNLVSLAQERWERARAEEALKASEERARAVLAALPDFVFVLAADGTHLDFHAPHPAALLVRPADFLGRRVRDVLPADAADRYEAAVARTLATGLPQEFGYELDVPGAGRQVFEARMVPKGDGVLAVVRDVTERRRLEGQLRQAQKMEAVGRLAGGIAHDFNNLLTVINGFADLLHDQLPVDDPNREAVDHVRRAGARAAELTRQLLAYGRKQLLRPEGLDLGALVTNLGAMLRRLIGEDVELALDAAPVRVVADPGSLEQVLMNLVVNARDTMPRGGALTIATRGVALGPGTTHDGADVRPGWYAELRVTDTGTGMPPEVLAHVFEPFFTTKGVGQGTGLGLATVFGIVKQSGGHVEVTSAVGAGTTFRVYLPAADAPPGSAERPLPAAAPARGAETILLVEDDDEVRALTLCVLQAAGYTVVDAANGEQALRAIAAYQIAPDLLVTDVVMPGMGGRELADRLTAALPGLRVLFMSGYTDDAVLRAGLSADAVHFLPKPFTPAAFAAAVRAVLDAGR